MSPPTISPSTISPSTISPPTISPPTISPPTISIVVISYNYAEYLPTAIDSALAQERPADVLVVDDGSTDASPEIIRGYGDRVRAVFKVNGGNSSVMNAALPLTQSDIVIFLDADDALHPEATAAVAAAWRPEGCKVQYRLSLIDAAGRRQGVDPAADIAMPNGDLVPQIVRTGSYVTPVTTGNAFSRRALAAVMPIPEGDFRNTNDGYLNLMVPFEGPVISLDRELGSYRLHGNNLWAFSGGVDLEGARQRITYDLVRQRYLVRVAGDHGFQRVADVPMRNPEHVLLRLVSLRSDPPTHPVPGDRVRALLVAGLRAAVRADGDPLRRAVLAAALPLVAVVPRALVLRVAEFALLSRPRGRVLRSTARAVRWLSSRVSR